MPAQRTPVTTKTAAPTPARNSIPHTARIIARSLPSAMPMKIGTGERMQSIVPTMLQRACVLLYCCCRSLTMPVTPYSVSNGSLSRNA